MNCIACIFWTRVIFQSWILASELVFGKLSLAISDCITSGVNNYTTLRDNDLKWKLGCLGPGKTNGLYLFLCDLGSNVCLVFTRAKSGREEGRRKYHVIINSYVVVAFIPSEWVFNLWARYLPEQLFKAECLCGRLGGCCSLPLYYKHGDLICFSDPGILIGLYLSLEYSLPSFCLWKTVGTWLTLAFRVWSRFFMVGFIIGIYLFYIYSFHGMWLPVLHRPVVLILGDFSLLRIQEDSTVV